MGENLQNFIGMQGYGDSLLYNGSKITPRLCSALQCKEDSAEIAYSFTLSQASTDTLIYTNEKYIFDDNVIDLGTGHKETALIEDAKKGRNISGSLLVFLIYCRVYHFHDTSLDAKIRKQGYINNNDALRADAGNLAAFLFALKNNQIYQPYYNRIVNHIRQIFPQFHDFHLFPSTQNLEYICLNWTNGNPDYLYGPHQISDGSLRFMALATLLLQPPELLPKVIILDEPELGLHPSALSSLAGMIRTASAHSQIILATQSAQFVNEFDIENIVITEYNKLKKCSEFKRLDAVTLSEWLQEYSLSELWEKNVLGGRP